MKHLSISKTTLAMGLVLCSYPLTASASAPLCPKVTQEYALQITSEETFTRERASQGFDTLVKMSTDIRMISDFTAAENDLMYLEGYLLKTHAEHHDSEALHEFCSFMKSQAYLKQ